MPSNEFTAIWQLIHPVAKDRAALTQAVKRLDGFARVINTKRLEMATGYRRDEKQILRTLASALGSRVTGCTAITAAPVKDCRMTDNEFCLIVNGLLVGESFWQALWTRYRYWWSTGLDKAFGQEFKKDLRRAVFKCAGTSVEDAVTLALKGTIWYKHRTCLQNGLWDAVSYYLGFVALGDPKMYSPLEPLVGSIFSSPPLCERDEVKGNWIVLTG